MKKIYFRQIGKLFINLLIFIAFLCNQVVWADSLQKSVYISKSSGYCLAPRPVQISTWKKLIAVIENSAAAGDRTGYIEKISEVLGGADIGSLQGYIDKLSEMKIEMDENTSSYLQAAFRRIEVIKGELEEKRKKERREERLAVERQLSDEISSVIGRIRAKHQNEDFLEEYLKDISEGETLDEKLSILLERINDWNDIAREHLLKGQIEEMLKEINRIIDTHLTLLLFNCQFKPGNVNLLQNLEDVLFKENGVSNLDLEITEGFDSLLGNDNALWEVLRFYKNRESQFGLPFGNKHPHRNPKYQAYRKACLIFHQYCDLKKWDSRDLAFYEEMEKARPFLTYMDNNNTLRTAKKHNYEEDRTKMKQFAGVFGYKGFNIASFAVLALSGSGVTYKFVTKHYKTLPSQLGSRERKAAVSQIVNSQGGINHRQLAGMKLYDSGECKSYNMAAIKIEVLDDDGEVEREYSFLDISSPDSGLSAIDFEIFLLFPEFHGTSLKTGADSYVYVDYYRAELSHDNPLVIQGRTKETALEPGQGSVVEANVRGIVEDRQLIKSSFANEELIGDYKEVTKEALRDLETKTTRARNVIDKLIKADDVFYAGNKPVKCINTGMAAESVKKLMTSHEYRSLYEGEKIPEAVCTTTLNALLKDILGGKGASLVIMLAARLLVPQLKNTYNVPDAIIYTTASFLEKDWDNELLEHFCAGVDFKGGETVSVRSGAPISLPGEMPTILNCGLSPNNIEAFRKRHDLGEQKAIAKYKYFLRKMSQLIYGVLPADAMKAFSAVELKISDQSIEEQVEMYANAIIRLCTANGNIRSQCEEVFRSPIEQIAAVRQKIAESWDSDKLKKRREAIHYESESDKEKYDELGTAVVIQKMVVGRSGVSFSKDSITFRNRSVDITKAVEPVGAIASLDGGMVAGSVRGKDLDEDTQNRLKAPMKWLSDYFANDIDLEFTITKSGKLFLLQSRPVVLTPRAKIRHSYSLYREGKLSLGQLFSRLYPNVLRRLITVPVINNDNNEDLHGNNNTPHCHNEQLRIKGEDGSDVIGIGASAGVAEGILVIKEPGETTQELLQRVAGIKKSGKKVIIKADSFHEKEVDGRLIKEASGIISSVNNMYAHGAIWARAIGTPAVIGVDNSFNYHIGRRVGIDGTTGKIYDLSKPGTKLLTRPPVENIELISMFKEIDEKLDTNLRTELITVLLASSDLFRRKNGDSDVKVEDLRKVIENAEIIEGNGLKGDKRVIVEEGDTPGEGNASVYIVISENIEVTRKSGFRVVIPNATVFGEASAVSSLPEFSDLPRERRSTVTVDKDAIVLKISENDFLEYFREHAIEVGKTARKNMRCANVQDNIGRGVRFVIKNSEMTILGKDNEVIYPKKELGEGSGLPLAKISFIANVAYKLNISSFKDLSNEFYNLRIIRFEGTPESRAAAAFAHIEENILYIDTALIDHAGLNIQAMTVIHQLILSYLSEKWLDKSILEIEEDIMNKAGKRLFGRIKAKAEELGDDPVVYVTGLRKYYAQYYLQENKDKDSPISINDSFTQEIRFQKLAGTLNIDAQKLMHALEGGHSVKNKLVQAMRTDNFDDLEMTTDIAQSVVTAIDSILEILKERSEENEARIENLTRLRESIGKIIERYPTQIDISV